MVLVVGLWIAGVCALLLGGVSLGQYRTNKSTGFFTLTCLGIAVWSIGIGIFLSSDVQSILLGAAAMYYIAAALIPYATVLLGYAMRGVSISRSRALTWGIPFFGIVGILALFPQVLIEQITVGPLNTIDLAPIPYLLYCLYFVVYFMWALFLILDVARQANIRKRSRYLYLFAAYGIGGCIGMWFNLILPAIGEYTLIWAGPLGIFFFVIIVFLAIIKHGLFDIRSAVARTLSYLLTLGILSLLYATIVWLTSSVIFRQEANALSPLNIGAALILIVSFQPIKQLFDRLTNSVFFRGRYSREYFYATLSAVLAKTTDLKLLLKRSSQVIADTLRAEQSSLMVVAGRSIVQAGTVKFSRIPIDDYRELLSVWSNNEDADVLVRSEIQEEGTMRRIYRILKSHRIELVMPVRQGNIMSALLFVGERKSGTYVTRDIRTLKMVSSELTIAIQNALSIREIQLLNDTLQQRIDDATKELRMSNAQLRRLDEVKDEFISMASHQLRTPLTSVKGYLDMVLEGDAGEVTSMQRKFLSEAFVSSERMVHLINDFLNVSRLQTGKFVVDKRPTSLMRIIDEELESLKVNADGRHLSFHFTRQGVVPKLMLDEAKIRQVVMNFADNALYYSKEGTTIEVTLQADDTKVEFTVKDTGIGVPKDEQAQLFTKFYRASNARKQRPDGTGVGLYLAKRVVTEHGGSIIFSSQENKGSTFGFRLPIRPLRVHDDADQLDK